MPTIPGSGLAVKRRSRKRGDVVASAQNRGICPTCAKGPRRLQYHGSNGPECSTCYQARRFHRARANYQGPCRCGCGRPGRSVSGYAARCLASLSLRTKTFRVIAETPLAIAAVHVALTTLGDKLPATATPIERESYRAIYQLVSRMLRGECAITRVCGRSVMEFAGTNRNSRP